MVHLPGHQLLFFKVALAGVEGDLRDPGGKPGLKPEAAELLKSLQVDLLSQVFPFLPVGNHTEDYAGHQFFGIPDNHCKGIGVTTQHLSDHPTVRIYSGFPVLHYPLDRLRAKKLQKKLSE